MKIAILALSLIVCSVVQAQQKPIVMVGMAAVESVSASNPYGWGWPQLIEAKTTLERETACKEIAKYLVAYCERIDAQGVIIWNAEGAKRYRTLGYEGDPRLWPAGIKTLFFELQKAGLKTGCTIRHTVIQKNEAGLPYHVEPWDVVTELIAKIDAAYNRGAIDYVYIDSNSDWLFTKVMDSRLMHHVHLARPHVLLIPEHATDDYYTFSLPYRDTREGIQPSINGREVINLFFGDVVVAPPNAEFTNQLKANFRNGSIPMVRWYDVAPELKYLRLFNDQSNRQ
jgi:hypothetical protein